MAVILSRHVTVIYVCHLNFKLLYFKLMIRIAAFHYLYVYLYLLLSLSPSLLLCCIVNFLRALVAHLTLLVITL